MVATTLLQATFSSVRVVGFDASPLPFWRFSKCKMQGMFHFARLVMMNLHAQSKAFRLRQELEWLGEDNEKLSVLGKLDEA
jgi:hypothetical protein